MIDLHIHSNISDGTLTPTEIVYLAKEIGLQAIALTDHDSIDGLEEAQLTAKNIGVNLINGIEFSVSYGKNRLLHILGIGIDPYNIQFQKIYNDYRKLRSSRLDHVFIKLNEMGVDITEDDVKPFISGGYMDRQAIAKTIVDKGYADIIKFAWIDYLDKIPYIEGELITPIDAFTAIHAAGGKAFMAHYHLNIGLKGYNETEQVEILKDLKEKGLDGLEFYYPSFTQSDSEKCHKFIEDLGFIKSGGTDFHGSNRAHIKLGVGEGDFNVPDSLLESF